MKKAVIYASEGRGVYVGRLERRFKRSNVPSTLLVSLEDDIELLGPTAQDKIRGKSFLIPSGMNLEVDTHGAYVAMFFLNDLGTDLSQFMALMNKALPIKQQYCFMDIKGEADVIAYANYLRFQRPALSEAEKLYHEWLEHPSRSLSNVDLRIAHAISLIKSRYDENVSVEWIAREVGLSVPRLVQLFKGATGTPIRRFRLWHRIMATASRLNDGLSLTDAAISAGFCDYAQFSRSYRELAGGNASQARTNTEIIISGFT